MKISMIDIPKSVIPIVGDAYFEIFFYETPEMHNDVSGQTFR